MTIDLAVSLLTGACGVLGAWLMRRRTMLSSLNLYLAATLGAVVLAVCVAARLWDELLVALPLSTPWIAAAGVARRWRLVDLGAGEELRNHELSRRWIWEPAVKLPAGERRYLRSQGELVHERLWPEDVEHVSMTASGLSGPRLPIGAGQHVVLFGATGAAQDDHRHELTDRRSGRSTSMPRCSCSIRRATTMT